MTYKDKYFNLCFLNDNTFVKLVILIGLSQLRHLYFLFKPIQIILCHVPPWSGLNEQTKFFMEKNQILSRIKKRAPKKFWVIMYIYLFKIRRIFIHL